MFLQGDGKQLLIMQWMRFPMQCIRNIADLDHGSHANSMETCDAHVNVSLTWDFGPWRLQERRPWPSAEPLPGRLTRDAEPLSDDTPADVLGAQGVDDGLQVTAVVFCGGVDGRQKG